MARTKQTPLARPASANKGGSQASTESVKKLKKKRRCRPGTAALRLLRKEQKNSYKTNAFKKLHIYQFFRATLNQLDKTDIRIGKNSIDALQSAAEDYGQELFGLAQDLCCLEQKQTPKTQHFRFAASLLRSGARRTAPDNMWNDGLLCMQRQPQPEKSD